MNSPVSCTRLVVVDDDPLFRALVCHMVELLGFQVVAIACEGQQAITVCRSAEPDLVLMDIMMPELNGIEAAKVILSEQDVPIVFVSGSIEEEIYEKAVAAGAADFLRKPFVLDDLRSVLQRHVRKAMSQAR